MTGKPMDVLSVDESWNLLSSVTLGRLVTCVEGHPEIFPVNFVVQRKTVLFRTAEFASKLFTVVMNARWHSKPTITTWRKAGA